MSVKAKTSSITLAEEDELRIEKLAYQRFIRNKGTNRPVKSETFRAVLRELCPEVERHYCEFCLRDHGAPWCPARDRGIP